MNERIRELANKAGLVATTMIDDSNRDIECYTDTSDGVPCIATIHKFAELIVKECVKLQHKNVVVGSVSDYNKGRRELAQEISNHFGINK